MTEANKDVRQKAEYAIVVAKAMSELLDSSLLSFLLRPKRAVDVRKIQLELLQDLSKAGIDPQLFDRLLSSELDRKLKRQFGVAFLVATVGFTLLSYAVIILNSTQSWGISQIAITALIIETPIQFIGLLYIIARNLFPQSSSHREPSHKLTGAGDKTANAARRRASQPTT
jgi:hypothetical protein